MKGVDQSSSKILPHCRDPASDLDVLVACGLLRELESFFDSAGHKVEGGSAFHDDWLVLVVGKNESGPMVGRIVAPPAFPRIALPIVMEGGTTFHFVTGGIPEALELAQKAASDKDVKIGGGVSTVRQYLRAGLIDSLHLASVPVLLGQGEPLFADLDLRALGFSVTSSRATEFATHIMLEKDI